MKIPIKWLVYLYMSVATISKLIFLTYFIILGKYISIIFFKGYNYLYWIGCSIGAWLALRYIMPFIYILLTPVRYLLVTIIYKTLMMFKKVETMEELDIKYQMSISNNFVEHMFLWVMPLIIFWRMGHINSLATVTLILYVIVVSINYVDLLLEYTENKITKKNKDDSRLNE